MTSQRQFMKVCECGIVLDANNFCNIPGLRRVYMLHNAAICNLINRCTLNEIILGFKRIKCPTIIYFSAQR